MKTDRPLRRKRHQHGEALSAIDFYAYHSGICHWNPAFKMSLSTALLCVCLIADNLFVSGLVLLITTFVTLRLGKLSLRNYLRLLAVPIAFLIMSSVAIILEISTFQSGVFSLRIGSYFLCISPEGIHKVFSLWGKAFGAVSAMYMMSLSTPSHEIFSVLRNIKVPALIVELMSLIYRFIFVLTGTFQMMKLAAESRLGYSDYRTSLRTFGKLASNLLVLAMKKTAHYYAAMESRCMDGELQFWETEKKIDGPQIIVGAVSLCTVILTWVVTS